MMMLLRSRVAPVRLLIRSLSAGGDHHHSFKIRDWSLERVEGIPELEKYQQRLALQGLRDPWIRNHCCAYDPRRGYLPKTIRSLEYITNGLGVGLALTFICIGIQQVKKKLQPQNNDHH